MFEEELIAYRAGQLLFLLVALPVCFHNWTGALENRLRGRPNARSSAYAVVRALFFGAVAFRAVFIGLADGWLFPFDLQRLLQPTQAVPDWTRMFFMLQLAFYLQDSLVPVQADGSYNGTSKLQYKVHHTMAVLLTCACMQTGFWNLGVFVVFLHDVSTMFLYVSKARFNLSDGNKGKGTFMAFALVFFVTRLLVFPAVVVLFLQERPWLGADEVPDLLMSAYTSMLVGLIPLHVVWGYKIIRFLRAHLKNE